jgi:hypothetical protein
MYSDDVEHAGLCKIRQSKLSVKQSPSGFIGANPVSGTQALIDYSAHGALAQLGRASGLQPECHRFKSVMLHDYESGCLLVTVRGNPIDTQRNYRIHWNKTLDQEVEYDSRSIEGSST